MSKSEHKQNFGEDPELFTSASRLTGNIVWNFVGLTLPLLAGLVAIPVLIRFLGMDRFGLLAIAWTLTGYFSLFDFGLGRALTKIVAELVGTEKSGEVPQYLWASLALMGFLGVLAAACLALLSPWIVGSMLNVPGDLQPEVILAFKVLSLSIPAVIVTTAFRGFLEAHQRFDLVNKLRMPLGLFTFAGPLLAIPIGNSLVIVFSILLAGRLLFLWFHYRVCRTLQPNAFTRPAMNFSGGQLKTLLRLGGWLTVSNLVGPIMTTMDRVFIGALRSTEAVAYYATPQAIIFRIQVIPAALMGVLFPAFSTMSGAGDKRSVGAFGLACMSLLAATFPLCFLILVFAEEGLRAWLGIDFSSMSTGVLQIFCIGLVINVVAQVPYGFLQSNGHARVTAIFHLIELPLYIVAIVTLISNYGIIGAAIAWLSRVAIDSIALFWATAILHPEMRANVIRTIVITSIMVAAMLLALVIPELSAKSAYLFVVIGAGSLAFWTVVMTESERGYTAKLLGGIFPSNKSS